MSKFLKHNTIKMTDKPSEASQSKRPPDRAHFPSAPNVRHVTKSDEKEIQEPTTVSNDQDTPSKKHVEILVYPKHDEFDEDAKDSTDSPADVREVKLAVAQSDGFSLLNKFVNGMNPPKPKDADPKPTSKDQNRAKIKAVQSDGLSIINKVVKNWAPSIEKVDANVGTSDSMENIDVASQTSHHSIATFPTQTSRQSSFSRSSIENALDINLNTSTSTQTSHSNLRQTSAIDAFTKALALFTAEKTGLGDGENYHEPKTLIETGSQYESSYNSKTSLSLQTDPELDVTGTQTSSDLIIIRDDSEIFQSLAKVNNTDTTSSQQTGPERDVTGTQTSLDLIIIIKDDSEIFKPLEKVNNIDTTSSQQTDPERNATGTQTSSDLIKIRDNSDNIDITSSQQTDPERDVTGTQTSSVLIMIRDNSKNFQSLEKVNNTDITSSQQTDPELDVTGTQTSSDLIIIRHNSEILKSLEKVNNIDTTSSQQTGPERDVTGTQTSLDLIIIRDDSDIFQSLAKVNNIDTTSSQQTDSERNVNGTQTSSDFIIIRDDSENFQSLEKVNNTTSSQQTDRASLKTGTTQTSADYSYSSKETQFDGRKLPGETQLDPTLETLPGECPKCKLIMRMIMAEEENLQNDTQFLDMIEQHKLTQFKQATREKSKLKMLQAKIDELYNKMESLRTMSKPSSRNDLQENDRRFSSSENDINYMLSNVAKIASQINRISQRRQLSRENSGDLSKHSSELTIKPKTSFVKGRHSCTSNCHLGHHKTSSKECSEEIITRKYYHRGGDCVRRIKERDDDRQRHGSNAFDREDRKCHTIQDERYCNCDRYQRGSRDGSRSIDDPGQRRRPQSAICGNLDRSNEYYSCMPDDRRFCSTAHESRRNHDDDDHHHHPHSHKGNNNEQSRNLVPMLVEFFAETAKLIQNSKEAKTKENDHKDTFHSKVDEQPREGMNEMELVKVDGEEFHDIKSSSSIKSPPNNSSQPQETAEEKRSSNLKEMMFQIIPSPKQKDKEKESAKEAPDADGESPVEATTTPNPPPSQWMERNQNKQKQSSTNASDLGSLEKGNKENNASFSHQIVTGTGYKNAGKFNIEDSEFRQFIDKVLSAIRESQQAVNNDFISSDFNPASCACSRKSTSADNCVPQRCRTAPIERATDFQCGPKRPRICSYFYPICFSSPSQCQEYCQSNQVQVGQNSVTPLQESFQQNNTACFQRVQWREQRLINSRQSRQSQNQRPPSTTAGTLAKRQRKVCNVGQQHAFDPCEAITYVVPPNRVYWQNM